jgi:acetyltransferase-like isoleucine patch superfamily enzyme
MAAVEPASPRRRTLPSLADFRARSAPYLRPVRRGLGAVARWRRKLRYYRDGIDGITVELRQAIDCVPILREFGATVGSGTTIYGPLVIVNASRDFSGLTIGDRVYIGPDVLIDLAQPVSIGNDITIVIRASIITHFDVGPGPLSERRPRREGPVRIEDGVFIGTGATILHGVTVGKEALIGAHALVNRDVPAGAICAVPATKPEPAQA